MKHLKHIFENLNNDDYSYSDYEELYDRIITLSSVIKNNINKTFKNFSIDDNTILHNYESYYYFFTGIKSGIDERSTVDSENEIAFQMNGKNYGKGRVVNSIKNYGMNIFSEISIVNSIIYHTKYDFNNNNNYSAYDHGLNIEKWLENTGHDHLTKLITELSKKYLIGYISYRKEDRGFIILLYYNLKDLDNNINKLYRNL
tara:strand:+ start:2766 stop:3368 length:603 start_codon:yes stop_codon:yes gene_type:complete